MMKKLKIIPLIVILIVFVVAQEGESQIAKRQRSRSFFLNPKDQKEAIELLEARKSRISQPRSIYPDFKQGVENNIFSPSSKNVILLKDTHSFAGGIQEDWVKHYESNATPSNDIAKDIIADHNGNVYITGSIQGTYTYYDYVTIKYDPSGARLWMAYYNGIANDFDAPSAMQVDKMGNVYVTGASRSNTKFDYCTIKYNSQGVEQWIARYNGSANGYDWANDIVVDDSGTVYVTGSVESLESSDDYLTIKYNSLGKEQWTARYNGTANGSDWAIALVVDTFGDVYVTGTSTVSDSDRDFITVKYNSDGIEQWTRRFNGSANAEDNVAAIVSDDFGNIYVTGTSSMAETGYDYVTIKYNSAGDELWVSTYNGLANSNDHAEAILIDRAQNIYVTGWSTSLDAREDYVTIKYNSDGVEQWLARYNGPDDADDRAYELAADQFGNIYVTGTSGHYPNIDYATIKYTPQGEEQWIARYNGPGNGLDYATRIAADSMGNIYVTGASEGIGTAQDFATIKYNTDGIAQWNDRFDGPRRSYDSEMAMVMDDSENVYVTGLNQNSKADCDIVTVKYDASGILQWTGRYSTPENYDEIVQAIALDKSGNVYVTGISEGPDTPEDYLTVKFDMRGNVHWAAYYNGEENGSDHATAIAVDKTGNVYVTGSSKGVDNQMDYATVKFNSSGIEQWIQRYNGTGNKNDNAVSIGVDDFENVYVTGSSWGATTRYDYVTIKYNSDGVAQWIDRFDGLGNGFDVAAALTMDDLGNCYVTGNSESGGTAIDYATIKYNSAGEKLWVSRYNSPTNYFRDMATAIVVDKFGNVIVTGHTGSSSTHYQKDYTTVKYSSIGQQLWASYFKGSQDADDVPTALAADSSGNVYVTGSSSGSDTEADFVTVKYQSDGKQEWIAWYNYFGNTTDRPYAISVSRSGNIYVAGSSSGNYWGIYTTIKYVQTPVSVEEQNIARQNCFQLWQNYPNPFNATTKISYILQDPSMVKLSIFNLLGKEIATLVNERQLSGSYEVFWDAEGFPSGTYFYRLDTGKFKATRKLALIK